MTTPLLQTKLYIPPPRPSLVPRPPLIERLNAGLHRKLTLVSAPAGFGKTTLLSEWAAGCDRLEPVLRFAWLSLDEGDDDPARFLAYLIAALQMVEPDVGAGALVALQSPQPPPMEALVTALINDIAAAPQNDHEGHPYVLVLDDYHLISSVAVHRTLRLLLQHQPSCLHVVVSTRQDPPLQLARLRVRGQITDIRERDLRFTAEESTSFLNRTMGLQLGPEAVATLETRTEGWIAGLQLAALALQEQENAAAFIATFAGDDRYVMDYLIEEVVRRQPEAIRRFLLHTAILNRLSAPLCDALLSDVQLPASSQESLEHLDAANIFLIPLDNKREWYRYHHLFADLLRHLLQREHPERLPDLHRRASRWYEQAGDADEAIHHALTIPDFPLAAHLAEQYGVRMVGGSRLMTYLAWVRRIPDDVIYARPYLCACCGWAYVLTDQVETAERYVQAGEAALPGFERFYVAPEERFVTRKEVRGHLTAIRAYAARVQGDLAGVAEYSRQALDQLPADAFVVRCVVAFNLAIMHHERGEMEQALAAAAEAFETAQKSGENVYVAISALGLQGNHLAYQGKLQAAAEVCRRAIELGTAGQVTPVPASGMGHWGLALVHYERNERAAAARHLEKALGLVEQVGNWEMVVSIHLLDARLALLAGDLARAEDQLGRAAELVQDCSEPQLYTYWTVARGELCLAQGDIAAAVQCAAESGLQASELTVEEMTTGPGKVYLPELSLFPRILLAQKKLDEALDFLDRLATAAEMSEYGAALIEALILQALARHLQGDDERALERLEDALALAAPQGYVRPFLVLGPREPMTALLRQAISRGIAPVYASKLLAAFDVSEGELPHTPTLVEPLSERERQVLRLVAAGLSNREIADELVVAVSTVKSHTNHIYGKLGVKSRTQAVARAQELGLL